MGLNGHVLADDSTQEACLRFFIKYVNMPVKTPECVAENSPASRQEGHQQKKTGRSS
jgi:hypothetical protein